MSAIAGATAVVLAGGRSSRMGTAKALLPFDREPLIVHIVRRLRHLFADVVIVAAPGQEVPPTSARLVVDDVPYQGPVGGLCYGLGAAGAEVAFVTSCDSAFLNLDLVAHLVAAIAEHDVVVPHWEGRLQPLHAAYRTSVLPVLRRQLADGELRPVSLFDKVRTRRIDEDTIRRFDPDGWSFFNMNTPEDYAAALTRWTEVHSRGSSAADNPRPPESGASILCTVELFGVARLLAGTREVSLALPAGATCSQLFAALALKLPVLSGQVIATDGSHLAAGYACNRNGAEFIRDPASTIQHGDRIVLLSADAGG